MKDENIQIRIEDESALDKITSALAISGLECSNIEESSELGFDNPEQGYAIFVGGILPRFKEEYKRIKGDIPRSYYVPPSSFRRRGMDLPIKGKKRDILARRVMLKGAIDSLNIEIEEQCEETPGSDYIIDSYYKICVENTKVGLFIKYPNGSHFPPGF